MAIYVIGDVQGCYEELRRLLDHIKYDSDRDLLWFAGDLVNRGPDSLGVLRYISGLGDRALTVLGNHDLHLLAAANGNNQYLKEPGLKEILQASDSDELCQWLQQQPFMHHDPSLNVTLIHAGLPPQWDLTQAGICAREMESVLRGEGAEEFFAQMYGNEPTLWWPELRGMARYRYITNAFTRLRYCTPDGALSLAEKGRPAGCSTELIPWFEMQGRKSANSPIIFGHWSTLGYLQAHNVWAIDTGCLWGGRLTALKLGEGVPRPIAIDCPGAMRPGDDVK